MPGGSVRAVRRLPDRLVRPAGRGRWRSPTAARRASPPPRARHQGEVIDEPKRADHEGTFVAGEAVAAPPTRSGSDVVGAATMAPVGWLVSALRTNARRTTASR